MVWFVAKHIKRYRDIGGLLIKYGRSDLVRQTGLEEALDTDVLEDDESVRANAEELADDLERMGPTFVKLGQFLSTRPYLLPQPYLQALSRLQDNVEPVPTDQIQRVLTSELGMRVSRAFADFTAEPLASASLGQVHQAVLHDGQEVVVKVQRPGVREQIADDLDALDDLAAVIDRHTHTGRRYQFSRLLHMLRRLILRELDYRNEADNLKALRRNLFEFQRIIVPAPVETFCTSRLLTMEYVKGCKVTDSARKLSNTPVAPNWPNNCFRLICTRC